MKLIGKEPINPVLFYSGKIAGYLIWIILLFSLISGPVISHLSLQQRLAVFLVFISLIFIVVSLVNLGASTRLGLPEENTQFKTNGIYKISRNPMYLGFDLLSLSAILYVGDFIVILLGIYSIYTYHRIILAEEKFLERRFPDNYRTYKQQVQRYL